MLIKWSIYNNGSRKIKRRVGSDLSSNAWAKSSSLVIYQDVSVQSQKLLSRSGQPPQRHKLLQWSVSLTTKNWIASIVRIKSLIAALVCWGFPQLSVEIRERNNWLTSSMNGLRHEDGGTLVMVMKCEVLKRTDAADVSLFTWQHHLLYCSCNCSWAWFLLTGWRRKKGNQ